MLTGHRRNYESRYASPKRRIIYNVAAYDGDGINSASKVYNE